MNNFNQALEQLSTLIESQQFSQAQASLERWGNLSLQIVSPEDLAAMKAVLEKVKLRRQHMNVRIARQPRYPAAFRPSVSTFTIEA